MAEIFIDKRWTEILRTKDPGRLCIDCGGFDVGYAVKPNIWASAIRAEPRIQSKKRLCINCLQKRLGRNLVIDDFLLTSCELILFGYKLGMEEALK